MKTLEEILEKTSITIKDCFDEYHKRVQAGIIENIIEDIIEEPK